MANQLGVVHPGMFDLLAGSFYPSTADIQEPTLTNTLGEVSRTWADVTGLTDIPCRVSPLRQRSAEVSNPEQAYVVDWYSIALAGHYATIMPDMRAVVDSVNYDIRGAERDGQGKSTYLMCKRVS